MNASTRMPRGRRGTFATVTALIGVLVSAAAAAEAVSMAVNGKALGFASADVAKFGRDTHLGDSVLLVVGVSAVAVGAVLIIAAVVPARRRLVELSEPAPNVAAGLTPRSLRRTLASAATAVDGISHTSVSGRRQLTVKADTSLRDTEALPGMISERVGARLDQLNPAKRRTVRVALNRKDG